MGMRKYLLVIIALGLLMAAGTVIATLTPPTSPATLINVSDNTTADDQADIAVDSSGNLHIVWVSLVDADGDGSVDDAELFYTKRSSTDASLIIPEPDEGITGVRITDFGLDDNMDYVHRPQIAVTGDRIHIVAQVNTCIRYMQLNQANYDPAFDIDTGTDPNGFIVVDPYPLDCADWEAHPQMAVDSEGNVHIVYDTYQYGNWEDVKYVKLDENGNIIAGPMRISTDESVTERSRPSVAVDPSGNAHIVWTGYAWNENNTVYYSMVNADEEVAVAPTRIVNDLGLVQSSVFASSNSDVEIILQEGGRGKNFTFTPVIFVKLNPTLADQDGTAADPQKIITVPPIAVVGSVDSYHLTGTYKDGVIHITTYGSQWGPSQTGNSYIAIDTSGATLRGQRPISNEDFSTTYCCKWNKAYSAVRGGLSIWSGLNTMRRIARSSLRP